MKSIINKLLVIIVLLTTANQLHAQQLPVFNNYVFNPFLYNPARAGDNPDGGTINLEFIKHYDNMPYGPLTGGVTWDSRIKESNTALGATLIHDRNGKLIRNTMASFTYNYRIPFNKEKTHELSIGIQAGIISQNFNGWDANTTDDISLDASIYNGRTTNFDLALGINYHWKGLNIGFSVPQVLNGKARFRNNGLDENGDNTMFQYQREYFVNASYEARFGGKDKKSWMVMPYVLYRYYKTTGSQLDLSAMFGYKQLVWLGAGYRTGGGDGGFFKPNAAGVHVTAGAGIKERVKLFYTFELPLKDERSYFGYTHEVTIQANLVRKVDKKEYDKNKQKVDDELAKVNQKADNAQVTADDALAKSDEALNKVTDLSKDVDKLNNDVASNSESIKEVSGRIDDLVFKKFGSVYFEWDEDQLTDEAKASLDAFKTKLSEMKGNYFIYLAGNASAEGNVNYNQALSARRCDAVKRYLEGVGISQRILLLPYGENSWVTESQNTEADKAKNRRVDIYLSGE
ncbi:MAG: PorP/SprF family type IX secretion system membrane protein [Chitinophagales bacterium]|nr:PorP/SprF family type IX secretion system membrane protein [Chitinophagales bacterium]